MLTSASLPGTLLGLQRIKSRLSLYYLNGLDPVNVGNFLIRVFFCLATRREAALTSFQSDSHVHALSIGGFLDPSC